jgi:hypothetical protein
MGPPPTRPELPISGPKAWLFGLIAIGLAVGATILFAEFVLHVIGYPPARTDHQQLFVEYDSVRGWRNIPGARGEYRTEEYDVALTYNSHGIRGPERAYAKPPGTYRVVLLGDSFLEGYSVNREERVAEVLERLLNAHDSSRRAEVIALGTAGYSTDQELLWMESEGLRYRPDAVVLLFCENDVWYNAQARYWRGGKPLFRIQGDSLVLTNVPVPPPMPEARRGWSLHKFLEQNSKLYWIVAGFVKNHPRLHALVIRAGLAKVPPEMVLEAGDRLPVPEEFAVYRTRSTPEVDRAWKTTELLMRRMRRRVEESGAAFISFLIPSRGDIYTQETAVRADGGKAAEGWDPKAVARMFHSICVREQIRCVDPTGRFRQAAVDLSRRGERLYYKYDWHWNANGHRLAAEILAEQLQAD